MPKNKNVLMNIHGVDFQIDDKVTNISNLYQKYNKKQ